MWRNVLTKYATGLLLLGILGGCASPQYDFRGEAAKQVAISDWAEAYKSIEVALGSDDSRTRLWGYDLLVSNPAIRVAATNSFSEGAVGRAFALNDPITANDIETYRLSLFATYATDDEVQIATSNIRKAFNAANAPRLAMLEARRAAGDSLVVTDLVFDQLTLEDQAQLKAIYPQMRVIPGDSIGKVVSSQTLDKSRPGSNAGSQLGAAFGQAAYVDRAIPSHSYSAVGQLGAGLVGAVLGSSLNRNSEQRFLVNYGIQLTDGTVKGAVIHSSDGVAAPVGQCVFVADAQEAPAYLCADSLVGFLARVGKLGRGGADVARSVKNVGVSCKLSVATLTLLVDECRRLNGAVVEK